MWQGGAGGNVWSSPNNWVEGVLPGVNDVAVFNNNVASVLDAAFPNDTVSAVTFQDNYTGAFQMNHNLTVNNTFRISGTGNFAIASGKTLTAKGRVDLIGRVIDNSGTINWSGNSFYLSNGAQVLNNLGATFTIAGGGGVSQSGGAAGTFTNNGTFQVTTAGSPVVSVTFNNNNLVNLATNREISLGGGGNSSGTFQLAGNTVLYFQSTQYTLSTGASITGDVGIGTVHILPNMSVPNPELRVTGDASIYTNFNMQGGKVTGAGSLSIGTDNNLTFDWTAGAMEGSGETVIEPSTNFNISGAAVKTLNQRRLINFWQATWSGGNIEVSNGARIENSGIFDITVDATIRNVGGAASTFANEMGGLLKKSAGNGVSVIEMDFENRGRIEVGGRRIRVNQLLQDTMGSLDAPAGSLFEVTGALTQTGGDAVFDGSTLSVTGAFAINGGTLTLKNQGAISAASGLTVGSAGTLDALGTITGNVVNNGQLYLGISSAIGNLAIVGSYTQVAGAFLHMDVATGGVSDHLTITGLAGLDGTIKLYGNANVSDVFDLIDWNSRSGAFATVDLSMLPLMSVWGV